MRATDAWIREKTIRKSQIFVNTMQFNAKMLDDSLSCLYFFFIWFALSIFVYMYLCTVYTMFGRVFGLLFALLSGRDTNGKVAGKRHFLSNSMVNLYVFYGVYMCKLVFSQFSVRHSFCYHLLSWLASPS